MRFLSEEAERLVQENQDQLSLKKDEIRTQEEKIIRLEKKNCKFSLQKNDKLRKFFRLDELQEANKGLKDDFHIVRATVQTLDKEKDRLCGEFDLKSEENLHLTQELNAKIRRIEELTMMGGELETALE